VKKNIGKIMVVYFFRSAFFKPHFQVFKKSLYLFIYLFKITLQTNFSTGQTFWDQKKKYQTLFTLQYLRCFCGK